MSIEQRLESLGITLPEASKPAHSYVRTRQSGNLLFVAGHTPKKGDGKPSGKVGGTVTVSQAQDAARECVINALSSVKGALGSLDRITGVLHVNGYVASTPDFTDQPTVMNAASDLIIEIFGEIGRHARTSIGVPVLPGDVPVEIEMVLEISGAS